VRIKGKKFQKERKKFNQPKAQRCPVVGTKTIQQDNSIESKEGVIKDKAGKASVDQIKRIM
jgi:hypothetical protein